MNCQLRTKPPQVVARHTPMSPALVRIPLNKSRRQGGGGGIDGQAAEWSRFVVADLGRPMIVAVDRVAHGLLACWSCARGLPRPFRGTCVNATPSMKRYSP